MRLLLITDNWKPKVDGVVVRFGYLKDALEELGVDVTVFGPADVGTFPIPGYAPARAPRPPFSGKVKRAFESVDPDAVHIMTEAFLGAASRNYVVRTGGQYTSSYTTQVPEYLKINVGLPLAAGYTYMRWFHKKAATTLCPSGELTDRLTSWGFENLHPVTVGVDTAFFHPSKTEFYDGLPRPVMVFVGRVALEKNLAAFLDLDLPGSKVIVGDGPNREQLETTYPDTHFLGELRGEDLAKAYASADVFVFPSKTDTLGNVLREANSSGVPIAAYPVQGPLEFVIEGKNGALDDNLKNAIERALQVSRASCRAHAETLSWRRAALDFLNIQVPLYPDKHTTIEDFRSQFAQSVRSEKKIVASA